MAIGDITMSQKETVRLERVISVEAGKISHSEASKLLGLSRRQVIRVRKKKGSSPDNRQRYVN